MAIKDQLRIPDAAKQDPRSLELLRVWVANQDQHVSLRVGVWEDPIAWGQVLADLAGHIANTYTQQKDGQKAPKMTRDEVLERIVDGFDAAMAGETDEAGGTDEVTGEVVE